MIQGETGTGKELLVHALHEESRRRDKAIVTVNCAALPSEAVELDLFGSCKTDGEIEHRGRLLAAEGSTLFLDNVEALPLSVQAKVLRFIEAGECQLQGCHKLQVVDVPIIAASSADILQEVEASRFRSDLFYRLQVVPINIPPLHERSDDIMLLIRHFAREYAGHNAVVRYTKEAERCLVTYRWPGNVRELMNFCQRMALLNPGKHIKADDLPEDMLPEHAANNHSFVLPSSGIDLAQVELDLIEQALEMAAGNRSRAARLLGITRDTLLYRMQKYSL